MWWFCCLRLQEMEHQLSIKPVRETSNWYGLENGVPNKQLVICIQFSVAPTMPPMPPHPGMAVSGIIAETMALSFMPIRSLFPGSAAGAAALKLLWHHMFIAGMETLWNDHKFITQICFMLCGFPLNPSFLTTRIPSHPQSRLLPTPHKDGTMVPLQLHLAPLKSGRKWPWFANGLEQLCNHHFLMLHHPNQSLSWMVKPC